jgi:hypothetical protein
MYNDPGHRGAVEVDIEHRCSRSVLDLLGALEDAGLPVVLPPS